MHFVYIDDSRDETLCAFSALILPVEHWRAGFSQIRDYRRALKASDGIYVYKELHAWKFVSGRGAISDRVVTKFRRAEIFKETLRLVATLPGARLINALSSPKEDVRAFERLANRVNVAMERWNSHALLISDEGKEIAYTKLIRKMGVYNPIPSTLGTWPEGVATRNIPMLADTLELAAALGVQPALLLSPAEGDVQVTPKIRRSAEDFRAWLRSQKPLRPEDERTYVSGDLVPDDEWRDYVHEKSGGASVRPAASGRAKKGE